MNSLPFPSLPLPPSLPAFFFLPFYYLPLPFPSLPGSCLFSSRVEVVVVVVGGDACWSVSVSQACLVVGQVVGRLCSVWCLWVEWGSACTTMPPYLPTTTTATHIPALPCLHCMHCCTPSLLLPPSLPPPAHPTHAFLPMPAHTIPVYMGGWVMVGTG